MRSRLTSGAALALALSLTAAGAGCGGDHTGISASPPFDPIGTEPASGAGGGGARTDVLAFLCDQSCMKGDQACPGFSIGAYCQRFCVMSLAYYPGCEAQYLSHIACQATEEAACFGGPVWPTCDAAMQALGTCISGGPPPQPE
jgi:hypothetical protein